MNPRGVLFRRAVVAISACTVAAVLGAAVLGAAITDSGGGMQPSVAGRVPVARVPHRSAPVPGMASGLAAGVTAPASASDIAVRVTGPRPSGTCQQIAYEVGTSTGAPQVVVVLAPAVSSTTAQVYVATLTSRGWECSAGMSARVGRNGIRPLSERRSGDGTTPAGVFPLGSMTAWDGQRFSFFGNDPDPGVAAGPYRDVRSGDCFGATPGHPDYGHLVYRTASECPGPDDEYLPRYAGTYAHAALIGANMEPDVSGDEPGEIPYAAAIFLHRHSYDAAGATKATSGCVSLRMADLVAVLRSMRLGAVFAIGTAEWLLSGAG